MADRKVSGGTKRSNSAREVDKLGQETHAEEQTIRSEQQEPKRWRPYTDFSNSDTGTVISG